MSSMAFILHIDGNTENGEIRRLIDAGKTDEACSLHQTDQTFQLVNYLTHMIPFGKKLEILSLIEL